MNTPGPGRISVPFMGGMPALEIYNEYGVKVEKGINEGTRTVRYNVAQLSAGLYLVKLAVKGKVMTEKLVVAR